MSEDEKKDPSAKEAGVWEGKKPDGNKPKVEDWDAKKGGDGKKGGWKAPYKLDKDVPAIIPIKQKEFEPLSQNECAAKKAMPTNNPVDNIPLEKCTPIMANQPEECYTIPEKELCHVLEDSEEMICYGFKYLRHLKAMTQELILLLEFEQKILEQVMVRIDKFKVLRDENKRKSIDWEAAYKKKIPEVDTFATKLINVPHVESITVEGVPAPVQQKILFQIVSRATNTANRVVVQLSMEEAVANDIDLTLQDLKKHCAVMLKQINSWLRMLRTQLCHQTIVIDRWIETKILIKKVKEGDETTSMRGNEISGLVDKQFKKYEERLIRIEEAICKLCGPPCNTCIDPSAPDKGKGNKDDKKSGKSDNKGGWQPPYVLQPGNVTQQSNNQGGWQANYVLQPGNVNPPAQQGQLIPYNQQCQPPNVQTCWPQQQQCPQPCPQPPLQQCPQPTPQQCPQPTPQQCPQPCPQPSPQQPQQCPQPPQQIEKRKCPPCPRPRASRGALDRCEGLTEIEGDSMQWSTGGQNMSAKRYPG